MSEAEGGSARVRDTTKDFLRSFSVVEYDSEDEFDELSPIPETPGDLVDGELHGKICDDKHVAKNKSTDLLVGCKVRRIFGNFSMGTIFSSLLLLLEQIENKWILLKWE